MQVEFERPLRVDPDRDRATQDIASGFTPRISIERGVAVEALPSPASAAYRSREEWQLACRVAASRRLAKSERLPKFLLYICEQYLTGAAHEITEQRIGTQIFNRAADYNPGEDNIVRSYARLLRKRLDEYFEDEGREESMRIMIPRGAYIPVFQPGAIRAPSDPAPFQLEADRPAEPELSPSSLPNSTPPKEDVPGSALWARWRIGSLGLGLGLSMGLLIALAMRPAAPSTRVEKQSGPVHPVWAQLFEPNRNTLIVPPDSGLGILENLTKHLVTLDEYASAAFLSDMKLPAGMDLENFNDLRRQRYTSVVALDIASSLTRLPEFIANRSQIRYARSITTGDIRNSNVILLGSIHTNPWVSLFEEKLNFRLEYTPKVDQSFVINQQPLGNEQKKYLNGSDTPIKYTYGTIAYLPSLDGAGHALIIQGLSMAGTQAAAQILFNPTAMKPILEKASLPDGSLKSFEALIETSSIGAAAPTAEIIATRFYM